MSAPQFNTIAINAAGEARFDGAGAVITLGTAGSNPTWTSAASNAAWLATFALPSANTTWSLTGDTKYVTGADFIVLGTGNSIFMTKSGLAVPTAANGIEWPLQYGESVRNSPELLRLMQFYIPANTKLYVTLYWGSL